MIDTKKCSLDMFWYYSYYRDIIEYRDILLHDNRMYQISVSPNPTQYIYIHVYTVPNHLPTVQTHPQDKLAACPLSEGKSQRGVLGKQSFQIDGCQLNKM